MKNLIFTLILLILVGCSPFKHVSEEVTLWKSYELERPIEISTGSVMVDLSFRSYYPTFEPNFIQEFPGGTLVPGQKWVAFYVLDDDMNKYVLTSDQVDNNNTGIVVEQDGKIVSKQPIIMNIKKIFIVSLFRAQYKRMSFDNLKDTKLFVRLRDGSTSPKIKTSLSAELIYGGVTNNNIVITYREFINDMARPAFYQELKYDLNKDNVIVFRSLKMKILEANNSKIVFQVIDDGGLPWFYRR